MITEFNFDDFIRNFYNNEVLKSFILRVRDNNDIDKDDSEKDDASNIAYYNGIKAFDVKKHKNKAKIEVPANVYKCNTTDFRKYKGTELETYKESKISLMNGMSKITFSFERISYNLNANSCNKDKYEEKRNAFETFIKDNYHINCTFQTKKNKETRYIIEFEKPISKPEDIIEVQCEYLKLFKYENNTQTITKSDDFDVFFQFKENINFSDFVSNIKAGISNYKSSDKLEKKYQHYFMLNANGSKTLFPRKDDEIVTHFEQEYGIINKKPVIGKINKKGYKTGRIDCIFYKYRITKEKIFDVSDIYLIEIKVDDSVILGNNGVMTHLEDIKAFLNYKENETPKKYDIKTLKERIKYRNNVLFGSEETEFNETNIHFYTVVGFTDEEKKEVVKKQIKNLSNEDEVFGIYNVKETIYKIGPDKSDCDIKFFFEKTLFVPKSEMVSTDFEDVTEELAPGFI